MKPSLAWRYLAEAIRVRNTFFATMKENLFCIATTYLIEQIYNL